MVSARQVLGLFAALALCATLSHAELIDQSGLATTYETILRFDCKMSIQYVPNFNRFVFDDSTYKYFSACKFDNFMWHHAMVSINATGYGFLVVDGEVQDLEVAFDTDDLNLGFQSLGRNFFSTDMYPNRCIEQTGVANVTIPQLPAATSDPFTDNKQADQLISHGYPEVDVTLHPANGTCCTFKIGMRCGEFDAKPFYGFLDEAVVWNRPLTAEEITHVLFDMPQNRKSRTVVAPRGVQLDLTAGRVFYGRWNNPCGEKPMQSPPSPPPPPQFSEGGAEGGAPSTRKLLGASSSERRKLQMSVADFDRQLWISDEAGMTGGLLKASGTKLRVTDDFEDFVTFSDFPLSSSYVYTGVPWAPPFVNSIDYDWDGPLPIDGHQQITISGVGFARSAWMKCVVVQPDPRDELPAKVAKKGNYTPNYYWPGDYPATMTTTMSAPFDLERTDQFAHTPAFVKFGAYDASERIHGFTAYDWDPTLLDTQFGEITPFGFDMLDPFGGDFILGYWEQITCDVPQVAFPSDRYMAGVSNDGTLTMSPPNQATMMDFGASFNGVGSIELPSAVLDAMGPTFTMSMWIWPEFNTTEKQTVAELTSFDEAAGYTGLFWQNGYLDLYLNNDYNTGVALELGMWHYITVIAADTSQGGQITLQTDKDVYGPTGFIAFSPNVAEFRLGKGFLGNIDQLKIWKDEVDQAVIDQAMFERESAGTLAYYRFSLGLVEAGGNTDYDAASYEDGFAFTALPAPWEPTILYTINGMEVDTPSIPSNIIKAPATGGDELFLTGFNFAPSKFLGCTWGNVGFGDATVIDSSNSPVQAQCDGLVEGQLGRLDGQNITLAQVQPLTLTEDYNTPATGVYVDQTEMSCNTPVSAGAEFKVFGPTNKPLMVGYPFEFQDQALHCDGLGGYVTADGAASVGSGGYTFHAWVYPYEMSDDVAERRRSLLSENKRLNRRQLIEAGLGQTVMAFESTTGGNVALLMYDGTRFFYYDDNILDAPADFPAFDAFKGGEWHIVTLTVDAEGQGYLYVDNVFTEHFTTRSMPPTSKFSLCQDYTGTVPSSFFYGKLDMVKVYNAPIFVTDLSTHHLELDFADPALPLAADFTFTGSFAGVVGAGGPAAGQGVGTASFVSSDAPWVPPTIVGVHPEVGETSAGNPVYIMGTNFAESQWTKVFLGDHDLPFAYSEVVSGVEVTAPLDPSCGAELPVTASNLGGADALNIEIEPFVPNHYNYSATMDDLSKDVLHYFTFTAVTEEQVDGVAVTAYVDLMNPSVVIPSFDELQMTSPNSVVNASLLYGPSLEVTIPATFEALEEVTISMWLFISSDTIHAWDADYPGFLVGGGFAVSGGWKLVTYVRSGVGANATVYVNAEEATNESVVSMFMTELAAFESSGVLGVSTGGMVGSIWIYGRAFKACEVAARFYTNEYALDTSNGAGASAAIPTVEDLTTGVTFEMWVHPYKTEGIQSLLATDPATGEGFDIALNGDAVSVGFFMGCHCLPCESFEQYTSWRALVPGDQWSQVGVTIGDVDGAVAIVFSVDGIFKDITFVDASVMAVGGSWIHSVEALAVGSSFEGLVYDLTIKPAKEPNKLAWNLKQDAQCPPLGFEAGRAYYAFNEGVGDLSLTQSGPVSGNEGKPTLAAGLTGLWVNATYDDATYVENYGIYGEDRFGVTVTKPGLISLTSYTACMKKRVHGGDPWGITMVKGDVEAEFLFDDPNDGNYHATFSATECGDYTTTLTYGDEQVLSTWTTTIYPDETVPLESFIEGGVPTGGHFGVPASFTIQTMDAHGCTKLGEEDLAGFNVTFAGPHDPEPIIVAEGAGRYTVHYLPEVAGTYYVEVHLNGLPIKEDSFCLTVTRGTGLVLDGSSAVVVEEMELGTTDLDLSFGGVTIEAWVQITAPSASMIVFKGSPTGEFAKGYDMGITADGDVFANVYVGLGETRTGTAATSSKIQAGVWFHVAAVYDGSNMTMYYNGVEESKVEFADAKPVITNKYNHPLTIGQGLIGSVDEVKLWHTARSAYEVLMNMYCPPYLELDLVAGYFGFNEGTGTATRGMSAACSWNATDCLTGTISDTSSFGDSALAELASGVGAPSAAYSILHPIHSHHDLEVPPFTVAGTQNPLFSITARDQCNYAYLGGSGEAYTAIMSKYYTRYITDGPPGVELPELVVEAPVPAVSATITPATDSDPQDGLASPGDCPAMGAGDGKAIGNFFHVALENSVVVGTYYMDVFANSVPFKTFPFEMIVQPAAPNTFVVHQTSELARQPAAGVPYAMYVILKDAYDNTVDTEHEFTGTFSIVDKPYTVEYTVGAPDISFSTSDHMYTVTITLGMAGDYGYSLNGVADTPTSAMAEYIGDVVCAAAPWQKLALGTGSAAPPADLRRFEHTMEVYENDLYVFGGASYNKTYLNDMWKLEKTSEEDFVYMSYVDLTYTGDLTEDRSTLVITLNTASLIGAGLMGKDCMDILITEEGFPFYIDPFPGCNQVDTVFYIKLPAGYSEPTLTILHGKGLAPTGMGAHFENANPTYDPSAVFATYHGFDDGDADMSDYTSAACPGTGSPSLSNDFSYMGNGSLYIPAGGAKYTDCCAPEPFSNFRMRAWFWDSGAAEMSHYISVDAPLCDDADAGTNRISGTNVGVYTLSNDTEFATSYPWTSSGVTRVQKWHMLEIESTEAGLSVHVDGVVVKTGAPITGDKVTISSGFREWFAEESVSGAHAYWDEISVLLHAPVSAGAPYGTTVASISVAGAGRTWVPVDTTGPTPPPRYSHTSVVYEGSMYVFGGERSAYSFNDLWKFDFNSSEWSIVTLNSHSIPPPRFDHTATVIGDKMLVVGGRSGHIFMGDAWVFDFTYGNWTQLTDGTGIGIGVTPRFGHSAALQEGTTNVYIFGGYTEFGFSNEMFKCALDADGKGLCEDITNGCQVTFIDGSMPVPTDLKPRYSHTSFANTDSFYVFGGSNLEEVEGFDEVWKFSMGSCTWEMLPAVQKEGRYEAALAYQHGFVAVHGGHASGSIDGDAYLFPIS